jgi:hypothetical protein
MGSMTRRQATAVITGALARAADFRSADALTIAIEGVESADLLRGLGKGRAGLLLTVRRRPVQEHFDASRHAYYLDALRD